VVLDPFLKSELEIAEKPNEFRRIATCALAAKIIHPSDDFPSLVEAYCAFELGQENSAFVVLYALQTPVEKIDLLIDTYNQSNLRLASCFADLKKFYVKSAEKMGSEFDLNMLKV
jgi:hypothetical protein